MEKHLSSRLIPGLLLVLLGCGTVEQDPRVHLFCPSVRHDTLSVIDTLAAMEGVQVFDVSYISFDAEGNIYFLDRVINRIEKFSPPGVHTNSISRQGDAPGEISSPSGFAVLNDNRLLLVDNASMSCKAFSTEGEFLGETMRWAMFVPNDIHPIGESSFVGSVFSVERSGNGITIVCSIQRFSDASEPELTYYSREWIWSPETSHRMYEEYERIFYTADSESNFFLVPDAGEYRIQVMGRDGTLLRVLERQDLERVAKTEEVIRMERELFEQRASRDEAYAGGYEPDPFYTLIRSVGVDGSGNLWVSRGDMYPDYAFDVWTPDGESVKTCHLASSSILPIEKCTVGRGGIVAFSQDELGTISLFTIGYR